MLINTVLRGDPFQSTLEVGVKPVPVTFIVAARPCATNAGEIDVSENLGPVTKSVAAAAVPGAEFGFCTVTLAFSTWLKAVAGTAACNVVELTNVVGIAAPSSITTAPETKFVPATVSCTAEPATIVDGESEEI